MFSIVGSAIWLSYRGVSVNVRRDGVYYSINKKAAVFYKFENFQIGADIQKKLIRAESRTDNRIEVLICPGIPRDNFKEMADLIQKSQTLYFANRNQAGNVGKEEKTLLNTSDYTKKDLSSRHIDGKPATADVTEDRFEKDIADDYNKIEKIDEINKTDESDYNSIPKTAKTESKPPKKGSPHEQDSIIPKAEFNYPKRAIIEAAERSLVIFILTTLALAVFVYLMQYLVYINSPVEVLGYELMSALIIFAISGVIISITLLYQNEKSRGLFSKLEVTDKSIVIDNTRYKFTGLSDMKMTSVDKINESRRICFTYDGKRCVYTLGPCKKPVGRAVDYFTRYKELYDILKDKGIKIKNI